MATENPGGKGAGNHRKDLAAQAFLVSIGALRLTHVLAPRVERDLIMPRERCLTPGTAFFVYVRRRLSG